MMNRATMIQATNNPATYSNATSNLIGNNVSYVSNSSRGSQASPLAQCWTPMVSLLGLDASGQESRCFGWQHHNETKIKSDQNISSMRVKLNANLTSSNNNNLLMITLPAKNQSNVVSNREASASNSALSISSTSSKEFKTSESYSMISESYEHDSSDSDDDEHHHDYDGKHDYDGHDDHGHKYGKHKSKGKYKKKKKVVYSVKKVAKKPKAKVHYKVKYVSKPLKVVKAYPKKGPKKVAYAYVYDSHSKDHHHNTKSHDHYGYPMKEKNHHYGHHKHHHLGKGRVSIAGLFGYTLMCVNYLMMLKEPHHADKYNEHSAAYGHHEYGYGGGGHGHDHGHHDHNKHEYYAASHNYDSKHYGTHSKHHHQHKGGPILLAHCSSIGEESLSPEILRKRRDLSHIIESVQAAQDAMNGGDNQQQVTTNSIESANSTLAKESSDRLLSPVVQNYLNQIVWQQQALGNQQINSGRILHTNQDDNQAEVILIGGNGATTTSQLSGNGEIINTNGNINEQRSGRLLANVRNRVQLSPIISLDVSPLAPELIARRDNLISNRVRSIEVSMRITARGHFSMAPLRDDPANEQANPEIVAVTGTATGRRLSNALLQQLSQAQDGLEIESVRDGQQQQQQQQQSRQPARQLQNFISIAPRQLVMAEPIDYVLSGDSIELSCRHRIPLDRVHSLRWFRDQLEFFRFIPSQGANRAKSFIPLGDAQLDLARSNSEVLSLRNVSHRSTGLYRCEVVSDGPNFETRIGELALRVYSLPNSGPQLVVLDRADIMLSGSPLRVSPLVDPTSSSLTLTRDRSLAGGSISNVALASIDDEPDPGVIANQRAQLVMGPLVRCQSARSYPVAQLRLTINGQLIDAGRLIENSTLTYADMTESNLLTFRLNLADFIQQQQQQANRMDQSASLNLSPPKPEPSVGPAVKSTFGTPAPKIQAQNQRNRQQPNELAQAQPQSQAQALKQISINQQNYANALVQFNDSNTGMTKQDMNKAKLVSTRQPENQNTGNRNRQQSRQRNGQNPNNRNTGPQAIDEDHESDTTETNFKLDNQQQMKSKSLDEKGTQIITSSLSSISNQKILRKRDIQTSSKQQTDNVKLTPQEQRIRTSTREQQDNNNQILQQIAYSNHIRVKCSSIIGQVRYEMSSELSVPLSVLAHSHSQTTEAQAIFAGGILAEANRFAGIQSPRSITTASDRVAQASQFRPNQRSPLSFVDPDAEVSKTVSSNLLSSSDRTMSTSNSTNIKITRSSRLTQSSNLDDKSASKAEISSRINSPMNLTVSNGASAGLETNIIFLVSTIVSITIMAHQ